VEVSLKTLQRGGGYQEAMGSVIQCQEFGPAEMRQLDLGSCPLPAMEKER
jgi:hypothetical protein